jgi:hypothetical protein
MPNISTRFKPPATNSGAHGPDIQEPAPAGAGPAAPVCAPPDRPALSNQGPVMLALDWRKHPAHDLVTRPWSPEGTGRRAA